MSFIKNQNTKSTFSKALLGAVFLLCFLAAGNAHAATLSLTPGSDTFSEGKTFTVRVVVNSSGQSINAVSGKLNFSTDTLTLTRLSKSGIVTLWAQEPTYSNASGSVSFQGVILNGYAGSSGTILTLTFKAKAVGSASINFIPTNSSVLLNDGQGTDALSGTSGALYTITKASVKEPVTKPEQPVEVPVVPEKPVIPAAEEVLPIFTDYQEKLSRNSFIVVKGKASPSSSIVVTVTQTDKNDATSVTQNTIQSSDTGIFVYVSDEKAVQGSSYSIVASTKGGLHTDPLLLRVKNSIWFAISSWIAALIAIQMSAALALLVLLLVTAYLLYRNHVLKQHLQMLIDTLQNNQQNK
jgi:hypothetical protein